MTRIEAIGHQGKGALKQSLGKVIGDAKLTADGAAERADGAAHNVGGPDRVAGIDTDRIMGAGRQFAGVMKQGYGNLMAGWISRHCCWPRPRPPSSHSGALAGG